MVIWEKIALVLLGCMSLVEVSPIKINPWSALGDFLYTIVFGRISKQLDGLETKITDIEQSYQMDKISSMRWHCLDFGNSCLQGRRHTREEWDHCIAELKEYEKYCAIHGVENGVMEEMARYLRDTYRERLDKKDFL